MGQEMADDPMMAAWMEYMTPGEPHRAMAAHAGKWNMTAKMWWEPNAPPQVSQNTATMKPIMGGRYMLEHVEGEPGAMMPGVTFKGMNIVGYDNHKKVYTFAWVDNLGTGIFTGEGSANADGTKITYMSEAPDLFNPGQMKPVKSVTEIVSDETDMLIFDELGGPVAELDGPAPGSGATITIEGAGDVLTVDVQPFAGRVTVDVTTP